MCLFQCLIPLVSQHLKIFKTEKCPWKLATSAFQTEIAQTAKSGLVRFVPLGKNTQDTIRVEDLSTYSWILPASGSPARRIHEQLLGEIGITMPHCQIEAYSHSMQSEILRQSNSIGLAFVHQCRQDEDSGALRTLPIPLRSSIPLGITQRRHTTLSPPAQLLREGLLRKAGEMPVIF